MHIDIQAHIYTVDTHTYEHTYIHMYKHRHTGIDIYFK